MKLISDFAERLRMALDFRNMKATELSELTGINKSTISQYLSKEYEPKRDRIELFAKILNVNEAWLTGYDVPMEANNQDDSIIEEYELSPDELKEYEDKVLKSKGAALALEKQLYDELFDLLLPHLGQLQLASLALSELDVLVNLAERAETLNYVAPQFSDEIGVKIENGRHPVVEQVLKDPFIANPVNLNQQRHLLIITGPNMGGKSTYMRQTALITLMAYIGSFVPADSAVIGQIDRIFTRIGASDDLASGRSTFMVEMTEMANILHQATSQSLVLIDEIGRGTSTYDGLSLAWACAEWLAKKTRSLTLFATHYFELTALPEQIEGIANIHLDALEHNNTIAFMHAVQDGAASKSYGLAVAALAGVPQSVIKLAKQKLHQLEKLSAQNGDQQIQHLRALNQHQGELAFEAEPDALREAIEQLDPDELSPKQALAYLYQLKKML